MSLSWLAFHIDNLCPLVSGLIYHQKRKKNHQQIVNILYCNLPCYFILYVVWKDFKVHDG